MRIIVCVGTRPDFIKMAPLIMKLEDKKADYHILHTGQHHIPELADIYGELGLRTPDTQICDVDKFTTHAGKTGYIMQKAESCFLSERADLVLVQGDTDHALACGLAARKLRMRIGHVESGLRSGDWRMPEEHNRRIVDHISEHLFAPTVQSVRNLAEEHVTGEIVLTGNTVVDALSLFLPMAKGKVPEKPYAILTAHREENVDDKETLSNILRGSNLVYKSLGLPVVFPVHPRTRRMMDRFRLNKGPGVEVTCPMTYLKFLSYLSGASLVLTDSGGVIEEACTLRIPCVVLRRRTDRPESVSVGASIVSDLSPEYILKASRAMIDSPRNWPNPYDPFGDRSSTERILSYLIAF